EPGTPSEQEAGVISAISRESVRPETAPAVFDGMSLLAPHGPPCSMAQSRTPKMASGRCSIDYVSGGFNDRPARNRDADSSMENSRKSRCVFSLKPEHRHCRTKRTPSFVSLFLSSP